MVSDTYTFHERAVGDATHELLGKDPEYIAAVLDTLRKLEDGAYSQELVDVVFQRQRLDLYTAHAFARVNALLASGDVLTAQIEIGVEPASDRQVGRNRRSLADLPAPFEAEVWRDPSTECDGMVSWNKEIRLGQETPQGVVEAVAPPRSLPLEIGATCGSRTLFHILRESGVARWPYGSKWLTLLVHRRFFRKT